MEYCDGFPQVRPNRKAYKGLPGWMDTVFMPPVWTPEAAKPNFVK
jgi:hypothetical protein